jgi:hypothetical protein
MSDEEMVVEEFAKNRQERVRVVLKTWKSRMLVDMRVHYKDNEGHWQPTPKGLCLQASLVPKLSDALRRACDALKAEGAPDAE